MANTTYVASYFAPKGHYSTSDNYFYSPAPSPNVASGLLGLPRSAEQAHSIMRRTLPRLASSRAYGFVTRGSLAGVPYSIFPYLLSL